MTRSARCLIPAICLCVALFSKAQQPASSQPKPAETLHTSTQLVIVDVVVEDSSGHPIHGLTRDNFVVTEQKKPQTIRQFEEHTSASSKKPGPPMPPMPPGTFSNYTPVPPDSTLNVLLLDALNTPMADQAFVRQQLLDYVKHEKPGTDVAIFGLTNRLIMLQGFSADPAILRTAVEHLNSKASSMLNNNGGGGSAQESLSEGLQDAAANDTSPIVASTIASLQQFEADEQAFQLKMRVQITQDAFNSLAHYLSNFPGRKNIVWFSGSFPMSIGPDSTLDNPTAEMSDFSEQLRETANLLALAQAAVYPADARGLMTSPMLGVTNSGSGYFGRPSAVTSAVRNFDTSQAAEHATMAQLASDTGGQAFYNNNGLADAVAKAIDDGSNYYTLTYNPTDRDWNGSYRSIHVALAGNVAAAQGLKLTYRRGYYADDPQRRVKLNRSELETKAEPNAPTPEAPADHAAQVYSHAAISHGAPEPQDILFKVRVLPLTGKNDDTLAADNQANPNGKMKGPYRTYAVDYVALPGSFSLIPQNDGRRTGTIEFGVYVYDIEGNLLNIADKKLAMNLNPELYKRFESNPVRFQLQVSAPAKQQTYMRLIIHDVPSNHYGVVEIPTAEVGHLPPLEAPNAPAKDTAEPPGTPPRSTGKQ